MTYPETGQQMMFFTLNTNSSLKELTTTESYPLLSAVKHLNVVIEN